MTIFDILSDVPATLPAEGDIGVVHIGSLTLEDRKSVV